MEQEYFNWLCSIIGGADRYSRLLRKLHDTDFRTVLEADKNRAADGAYLRYIHNGVSTVEQGCTVLELMIATAIRVENFMATAEKDDQTAVWFWGMITSMGLRQYNDIHYNDAEVNEILTRFMDRDYQKNGSGGLFTVSGFVDMRELEIWRQMQLYLSELHPVSRQTKGEFI